jgi:glycosyltransferase involved in cell wall biosynthesis
VERVRITYCGTLGLMHDTATFLGWLDSRVAAPVSFAFHTSGASKQSLEVAVRERAATRPLGVEVLLGNALDEADWIRVMRETQVGLVFQDAGSGKVIFPSKMASILAAGQAVLAVADFDSEVARLILDHDCGWVVAPGDTHGFQRAIEEMADAPTLQRKRANAHRLGRERFGNEGVARQWVALFDEIPGGNAP